jgi:hypothetical protein
VGRDRQGLSLRHRRRRGSLADLFRGARSCSSITSCSGPTTPRAAVLLGDRGRVRRLRVHLANHDVMLWAVSRAPIAKLQAYKQRMGWTFPWASSFGRDFNSTSTSRSPRSNSARGLRIQLPARASLADDGGGATDRPPSARRCRNDVPPTRASAGHERVRARGRRRLPHLLQLTRADSTSSGACTSGSTARRADGTSSGGRLVAPSRRVRELGATDAPPRAIATSPSDSRRPVFGSGTAATSALPSTCRTWSWDGRCRRTRTHRTWADRRASRRCHSGS